MDDPFLAALLRRAAGILCPCSASTMIASVMEGLQYLVEDRDATERQLADLTEMLIVTGDLLELNQVTTDDPDVKSTWLFAAPPSFVARPDGTIFLLGIVADEVTPLPASLAANVVHEGVSARPDPGRLRGSARCPARPGLAGTPGVSLAQRLPGRKRPHNMRDFMLRKLEEQPASGAIADLMILDASCDPRYYARRWVKPTDQTGHFVARRPQAHGASLWGFAALANGAPTRFLDLPLKGTRWRGCDVAWHLQMAIDEGLGRPQTYRRRDTTGGILLDFFSPLPLWATRRLAVLGHPVPPENCLFTYWLPNREAALEEDFLRERLWLTRQK